MRSTHWVSALVLSFSVGCAAGGSSGTGDPILVGDDRGDVIRGDSAGRLLVGENRASARYGGGRRVNWDLVVGEGGALVDLHVAFARAAWDDHSIGIYTHADYCYDEADCARRRTNGIEEVGTREDGHIRGELRAGYYRVTFTGSAPSTADPLNVDFAVVLRCEGEGCPAQAEIMETNGPTLACAVAARQALTDLEISSGPSGAVLNLPFNAPYSRTSPPSLDAVRLVRRVDGFELLMVRRDENTEHSVITELGGTNGCEVRAVRGFNIDLAEGHFPRASMSASDPCVAAALKLATAVERLHGVRTSRLGRAEGATPRTCSNDRAGVVRVPLTGGASNLLVEAESYAAGSACRAIGFRYEETPFRLGVTRTLSDWCTPVD